MLADALEPQVGVRHTGGVIGQAKMVAEDWKQGVRHDDEIGVSPWPSQKVPNVSCLPLATAG